MKTLLALIALSGSALAAPPESFWKALHQVETSGRFGAIKGDGGAALGGLQIHRAYHADSGVPGPYEQVSDLSYARKVATAYFKRYAPEAWERGDVVTLARIHNGGPRGHHKAATLAYSRKVLAAMGRNQ
jgi:predicted chitinase